MTTRAVEELAERLIQARLSAEPIDDTIRLPVPGSLQEASLVDDAVAELSRWPVLGWKIACTSEHAQELLGTSAPFAGRVYSVCEVDGETVAHIDRGRLCSAPFLEGEFAFTIGPRAKREPPQMSDLDERQLAVWSTIDCVRPAIEVVGGRFGRLEGQSVNLIAADAASNSLLIVGEPTPSFDPASLVRACATMEVDGEIAGQGSGADVLGGPFDALCWLVAHLGGRDLRLEPGQVVTTGTATQICELPVGATAKLSIEGLGSVVAR